MVLFKQRFRQGVIEMVRTINRKLRENSQDTHRSWRVNQKFGCFCEIYFLVIFLYMQKKYV